MNKQSMHADSRYTIARDSIAINSVRVYFCNIARKENQNPKNVVIVLITEANCIVIAIVHLSRQTHKTKYCQSYFFVRLG